MERFKASAMDGAVLGVKILAVLAVLLLGAGWIFGDYAVIRTHALHGEQVYQSIIAEQQKKAAAQAK